MSHQQEDLDLDISTKKEKKAFYSAICVAVFFMLLELIGGICANSLALISDALHMFTDTGALILGLVVVYLMKRPSNLKRTYGYHRAEILGALASGVTLWILTAFLVYEAIERLFSTPPVNGITVFIIAVIGLFANLIMMKLLHPGELGSLNLKAAYLHVIGDLLGSAGVIISGIIIWLTHWYPIDAICTILFAIIILYSSGKMIKQAIDILMETTPKNIDGEQLLNDLFNIPGVKEVHDLHIWNISTRMIALSAHLITSDNANNILKESHDMLQKKYNIRHTTLQIVHVSDDFICHHCFECQKNGKTC